jgi:hypothetical protein
VCWFAAAPLDALFCILRPVALARASDLHVVPCREPSRGQALIFLHEATKDTADQSTLPAFLLNEPELASWDIIRIWHRPPYPSFGHLPRRYPEIAVQLNRELAGEAFSRYKRLALVGHGGSGLAVRRAILDNPALERRVSHLILLGVPTAGIRIPFLPESIDATEFLKALANAISIVSFAVPLAGGLLSKLLWIPMEFFFGPAMDLLSGSKFLRELNQGWKDRFKSGVPFHYWAVAAKSDRLVSVDSLLDVPQENRLIVEGDHFSLIRPQSEEHPALNVVRTALTDQAVPTPAQRDAEAMALLEDKQKAGQFDVFLWHGWTDRIAARIIGNHLKQYGIRPWITEELDLEGRKWADVMAQHDVGAVAVCFGKSKPSEKEQAEILPRFESKSLPVIPLFLPDYAGTELDLPDALKPYGLIDFRARDSQPLRKLVHAIDPQHAWMPDAGAELPELYPAAAKEKTMTQQGNPNPGTPQNQALAFGQIAGFAGLTLYVVLCIFGSVLQQKFFPTLQPSQATLLLTIVLLLTGGLAFVGAVIWANEKKAGKSTTGAIVGILVLVIAGTYFLTRPLQGSAESTYRIRVMVLDPDHMPLNTANVTSNVGEVTKRKDDGWELAVHQASSSGRVKGTITAAVQDDGLRGETVFERANTDNEAINVQLEAKGEARIRGTVVDENNKAVPRAFVGIPGYTAVTTSEDGNFNLPAHVKAGEDVDLHAEKDGYRSVLKPYRAGLKPVTVELRSNLAKPVPPASHSAKTGDAVIDRVLARLASLDGHGQATESQYAEALAPLFTRPAFYAVNPADWQALFYPLCRTRLLIEQYRDRFKSDAKVRADLGAAAQRMAQLQDRLASMYGPNFRLSQQIQSHIANSKEFTGSLPSVAKDVTDDFIQACNGDLHAIRVQVKQAGFPI